MNIDGPAKFVVAEALNQGRTIIGQMDGDRLTLYTLDQLVSIEAHPNLHAVNFLTMLAVIVLKDERLPTDAELDECLRQSVRGRATFETPIGWAGMKESFLVIAGDCMRSGNRAFLKDLIASTAREVSGRLDETLSSQLN